ncbi:zinc dependent phospholipase C family protein [Paenibacillus hemerocallicola]|uniref:Zinc dependent phospholipase C family protein n=1 Tax=Paenibacillus hemerocallicola TaxID=1172614 RepID=A0A5C4T1W3_9BACL|nr:zinc dependent phospholipase C family protein [Paenibacillus hemerocallicola]TNJ63041.1 zinc dependent phospholipase C family protein [Paenibacillus hemerocallicola]
MPLPMVHFSFAVKYFDSQDVPDTFLLGSIAPDAIHIRKSHSKVDKMKTHFNIETELFNLETLKEHFLNYLRLSTNEEWNWFVRGYFTHLLTDHYWFDYLNKKLRDVMLKEKKRPEELKKIYYQETEQIDFNIYNHAQWCKEIWSRLLRAQAFAIQPILTVDEVNYWRYRTIHWFDLIGKEPKLEPTYITERIVAGFLEDIVPQIKFIMKDWEGELEEDSNIS